jgi:K+ transporter
LSDAADDAIARPANVASLSALGLSALGIVFGDIGTSPLYTLKTVLNLTGGAPDPSVTLGVLSLVIWTLIIVTTIKYVPSRCASTMTARAASLLSCRCLA